MPQDLPEYPGVKTHRRVLADGEERLYCYFKGERLPGKPGSREFHNAYVRLSRGEPLKPVAPEMFEDLVKAFIRSPEHRRCCSDLQKAREAFFLKKALPKFGGLRVDDFNDRQVRTIIFDWRDEMAGTPCAADHAVNALSRLLEWAYDRGKLQVNHARKIEKLYKSDRSEKIWTPELERRLLADEHPEFVRLWQFGYWTAMRQGDLGNMAAISFDGEWLVYKPQKTEKSTGVTVHLPVFALPPLAALLSSGPWPLVTPTGKAWHHRNIGKTFQRAKEAAGMAGLDLHFHDLRGTTVTRLLEAGCTEAEVASITGHSIGKGNMIGRYAQRSREYALNAYTKWSGALGYPPPSTRLRVVPSAG
jgi:integrase